MDRPAKTNERQREAIRNLLLGGTTVTSMAKKFEVSRATIIGIRDAGSRAL
jgi:putative DNA-invertase from lambdoid prophage Rac